MSNLVEIEPEYIYVTIPAEYICVYHRILAMMADYGEDMLKDCKASCTDRNSNTIECFNMFNAAVAAKKLGAGDPENKYSKLAATLIKYIKAKINQIYQGKDNSTSFVFPVDETGHLKAFVSCGERPKFEINADDGKLYKHKFDNGFDEHFRLGPEDTSPEFEHDESGTPEDYTTHPEYYSGDLTTGLCIKFVPDFETEDDIEYHPCGDLYVWYNGEVIDPNDVVKTYYFEDEEVDKFEDVVLGTAAVDFRDYNFKIVVTYKEETQIINIDKHYEITD